jgi:hypothetical protein
MVKYKRIMAIKREGISFIGTVGGICGYLSHGRNIIRAASPLTGARTKKDPAFEGFRQSGNRMKQASPLAAALYSLIPEKQRQYSLYRRLTGEALKMIKQGVDKEVITETLRQVYIEPLLQPQAKQPASVRKPTLRVCLLRQAAGRYTRDYRRPQQTITKACSAHARFLQEKTEQPGKPASFPARGSSSLLLPAGLPDRPGLRTHIRAPDQYKAAIRFLHCSAGRS